MLPKIFEYKPTGVIDTDPTNNVNDWNTKFNGTQIITNVQYDTDLQLPFNEDAATGVRTYYSKDAVKEIDFYGYYTNSASKGTTGGIYILKTIEKFNNKNAKNYIDLIVYQSLDYTADENFEIELEIGSENYKDNDQSGSHQTV